MVRIAISQAEKRWDVLNQKTMVRGHIQQVHRRNGMWNRPETSWIKVNFSWALLEETASVGVICRNSDGDCMVVACRKVEGRSVSEVELMGAWLAISAALENFQFSECYCGGGLVFCH